MTALESLLRTVIETEGPLPLDRYMELCLGHPQHGYYMTHDPLGSRGDFTTAPEISQVFGELVGLWVAQVWIGMGSPPDFALVEFGPGRGTLMKDLWRATRKVSGFHAAAKVHLVEISPVLRDIQQKTLVDLNATWHLSAASLPLRPTIVVANEFFDAVPTKQYEINGDEILERHVGADRNGLCYSLLPSQQSNPLGRNGTFESAPARDSVALTLGHLISDQGGAALVIDYGHRKSAMGNTLQAMKAHAFCNALETPGEVDITSHVDFEALGRAFSAGGACVYDILTQGEFLTAMGVGMRAQALLRSLSGKERDDFTAGVNRLADDLQMGQLFKVMAVTCADQPAPYPFGVL